MLKLELGPFEGFRDIYRVVTSKAGGTKAIGFLLSGFEHPLPAQISEGIYINLPGDFCVRQGGGDQLILAIGVNSIKAGVGDRW